VSPARTINVLLHRPFGEIVEPADAVVMPKVKLVSNSKQGTWAGAWVEGVRRLCCVARRHQKTNNSGPSSAIPRETNWAWCWSIAMLAAEASGWEAAQGCSCGCNSNQGTRKGAKSDVGYLCSPVRGTPIPRHPL